MPKRIPCHWSALFLTIPLLLVCTQSAEAQRRGKGPKKEAPSVQVAVEATFSTFEREQIVRFFAENRTGKAKPLPPGIRKNLGRGKPLPPGIAKRVLPDDLGAVLPERAGYQRIQVGLDILLVEVATGVIHDILLDVIG